jgi:hypothetical protein
MSRLLVAAIVACVEISLFCHYALGSEAEQKAQQAFESLYGADVKRASSSRDTSQAVALAAKLLAAAKTAEAQPELMALLAAKACELGSLDPKGHETALAAAAFVSEKAPELAGPCQDRVMVVRQRQYDMARGDQKTKAGEALVDALVASAAAKTRAGDTDDAGKRLQKALGVARAARSSKVEAVEALIRAMAERQKAAAQATQLKKQVEADPANAKARDQLVRLLLVDLDNPAEAAKCLDETSDAALRKFVPAAAKPVAEAPEVACLELADWYMQLTGSAGPAGKAAMYTRAKAYAERFLDLHGAADMDRTRMELALKKAEDELTKLGGEASTKSQWIDLLKLIDPEKDAVTGKWERTKAGLATPATGEARSRVQIPLMPSGSYDLEVKFVRVSGHEDVALCLPAGSGSVTLIMSAWDGNNVSGLGLVNGRNGNQNETTVKPGALANGHLYTAFIRVAVDNTRADITITLDGKPYIKWAGPQQGLSPDASWGLRNTRCVGLGACNSEVVFHSVGLRMLSGKAVPVASNRP